MAGSITRFLGDSPGRTIVKLIVVSFLVGYVMSTFDWSPWDVIEAVGDFFVELWETGFAALGRLGAYIVLGAVVVVPLFFVLRLASYRR